MTLLDEVKAASAVRDVLAERHRQIEVEGFDAEHDNWHTNGELAEAAACYAMADGPEAVLVMDMWPWDASWWKPKDRRKNLIRAAALILAEIERLDHEAAR